MDKYELNPNGIFLPNSKPLKALYLSEVEGIAGSEDRPLNPGNLEEIIEEPLRNAVAILMAKNIPTHTSNANISEDKMDVYLNIYLRHLSLLNQQYAKSLINAGKAKIHPDYRGVSDSLEIFFPNPTAETSTRVVSAYFSSIAEKFKPQENLIDLNVLWQIIANSLGFKTTQELNEHIKTKEEIDNLPLNQKYDLSVFNLMCDPEDIEKFLEIKDKEMRLSVNELKEMIEIKYYLPEQIQKYLEYYKKNLIFLILLEKSKFILVKPKSTNLTSRLRSWYGGCIKFKKIL